MVMVTTAPLVCSKIMFTQALNVSGPRFRIPLLAPLAALGTGLSTPACLCWVLFCQQASETFPVTTPLGKRPRGPRHTPVSRE